MLSRVKHNVPCYIFSCLQELLPDLFFPVEVGRHRLGVVAEDGTVAARPASSDPHVPAPALEPVRWAQEEKGGIRYSVLA